MFFNITFRRAKLEILITAEVQTFPPKLGWYRKVSYSSISLIVLSEHMWCVNCVNLSVKQAELFPFESVWWPGLALGTRSGMKITLLYLVAAGSLERGTTFQTHGSHHALIKLQHPADTCFLDWLSRHCILENNTIAIPHTFTTTHFCKDIFHKLQRAFRYFLVFFLSGPRQGFDQAVQSHSYLPCLFSFPTERNKHCSLANGIKGNSIGQ